MTIEDVDSSLLWMWAYLSDLWSVSVKISDREVIGDFFSIHLEQEAEVVRTLASLSGRQVTHYSSGGGVLRVLQQEVPVDGILAGDRHKFIGKPDLKERHEERPNKRGALEYKSTLFPSTGSN